MKRIICERCRGSGTIGVRSLTGRGETPGPVPEEARGWRELDCPDCHGKGEYVIDDDEEETDDDE